MSSKPTMASIRIPSNSPFAPALVLIGWALVGWPSLACDATLGSNDEVGSDSGGSDSGASGAPCSADDPCPDGQSCFNGLCALDCTNDADCGAEQWCNPDSLCQDQEVMICASDDDCDEGQICFEQFCSTPPVDTDCEPWVLSMDGCPSDAICMADPDPEVDAQACHTMPACAADHTCPIGLYGALCNDGYIPDKDEICLIGICDTVEHCPADWLCVRAAQNDPLGFCSSGGFGEGCSLPEHCLSGMCYTPIPGLPGFCQ